MSPAPEQAKFAVDAISAAAWITSVTGAISGVIGIFAGLASLIWFCIRIYETKAFQAWRAKRRK